MFVEFRCILISRETKKPFILYPFRLVYNNDIEQAEHDVLCEETDYDFICISCKMHNIISFM